MNLIDLFAIIPFYLSILLEGLEDFEIIGKAGKIVRLVKVMFFQCGFETAGLEPVLSYSEIFCMALYYRQFSTNIKIKFNTNFV